MKHERIYSLANEILEKETKLKIYKVTRIEYRSKKNIICIPDVSLDKYLTMAKSTKNGYFGVIEIENLLKKNSLLKESQTINALNLAVFELIHEEGHFVDFATNYLAKNLTYHDFVKEYEQNKVNETKVFLKEYDNRKDDGAYQGFAKLYRKRPMERKADNYAIQKIQSNSKLLGLYKNKTPTPPNTG